MRSLADDAARLFEGARSVAVLTGSGMSQESGVPTFRDAQTGLWARYDPAELATPEAFERHPARVFGWYLWRWKVARAAKPHSGYYALAELGQAVPRFVIITQNVDGLHRRAGSEEVVELHGSLERFRCAAAGHPYDAELLEGLAADSQGEVEPPRCPRCSSPIRPGVVWFGEPLPAEALDRAWRAAQECDLFLVVGTSGLVYPAAELPWVALRRGARLIDINPSPTPFSPRADLWWNDTAGAALPELARAVAAISSKR
ncbi:MAG: NAD-dependent protein deacylase 1 [Gemmatimonadales bacterium]|nr:MAG: NAD-dependent protein deacylase 1 [Gemmatimonadales bacterium]